jgi:hypothetical protein
MCCPPDNANAKPNKMDFITRLLTLLFVGAVLWMFELWRRKIKRDEIEALSRTCPRTTAVVVEVWLDSSGVNITYEFSPRVGKSVVRRTETIEEVPSQTVNLGDQIEVAYEPFSPYYSRIMFARKAPSVF